MAQQAQIVGTNLAGAKRAQHAAMEPRGFEIPGSDAHQRVDIVEDAKDGQLSACRLRFVGRAVVSPPITQPMSSRETGYCRPDDPSRRHRANNALKLAKATIRMIHNSLSQKEISKLFFRKSDRRETVVGRDALPTGNRNVADRQHAALGSSRRQVQEGTASCYATRCCGIHSNYSRTTWHRLCISSVSS